MGQPWASHPTGKGASQACDWSLILSFKPQEGPSRPGQPGVVWSGCDLAGSSCSSNFPLRHPHCLNSPGKEASSSCLERTSLFGSAS